MDVIVKFLFDSWKNKKTRIKLILAAVLLIMAPFFTVKMVVDLVKEEAPPPGSILAVKCRKCGIVEARRILDTGSATCSKCGGELGLRYKCIDCGFEFPYMKHKADYAIRNEKNRFKALEMLIPYQACPNCGSSNTQYEEESNGK